MRSFEGKNVFITGASSGIGAALAREFARRRANLVLVARRTERLESLAAELRAKGRRVAVFACDVARDGDLSQVAALARAELGPMSVVVANAGFGVAGNVERLKVEDFHRQFQTNFYGVLRTLYATLDDLKQTKGHFAAIGSVNGYLALPGNSPYAASKFALRGLCASLVDELAPYGIAVTHIAPGFVVSEIRKVDNFGVLHPAAKDRVPAWIQMPADTAARQIVSAIAWRRRETVVTFHGKFVVWIERHFPWLVSGLIRLFGITARPEP